MNPLFEDYKAIRARIEQKLSQPDLVLGHVLLFVFVSLLLMMPGVATDEAYRPGILMVWAFILALHGLSTAWWSGVRDQRRNALLKKELQERFDSDDTILLADARTRFHVETLLDDDLRKRSGVFIPLSLILVVNIAMWFFSMNQTDLTDYSGYWHDAARMLLAVIVPAMALNRWCRTRRDQAIAARLDDLMSVAFKRKHPLEDNAFHEEDEFVEDAPERLTIEAYKKTKLKV